VCLSAHDSKGTRELSRERERERERERPVRAKTREPGVVVLRGGGAQKEGPKGGGRRKVRARAREEKEPRNEDLDLFPRPLMDSCHGHVSVLEF
jgi:hypothetical protein